MDEVFRALADPSRRRLLDSLNARNGQSLRELCAGLDMAWVASGLLDGYWEHDDGPWDWAVGALLVREAGGSATTYAGADWRPGDATMVASNGHLHASILQHLDRSLADQAAAGPAGTLTS